MDKKQIALMAVDALKAEYPDAICSLVYTDPLQLLIATRLAAQCTDARVNIVTPALLRDLKPHRTLQILLPKKLPSTLNRADFIKQSQKTLSQWQKCFARILTALFPTILTI